MSNFIDEAQIHAKGGDGGAGAVAFRREAHVAKGGPDGGDGGRGGNVYLEASANEVSLLKFKDHPYRRAQDGGHGGGSKKHGRTGEDLTVTVPVGTVIKSLDGTLLGDLVNPGDRLLAASGGRSGRGNASFLSNKLRAPAFSEQGEPGEERWMNLELKLLADVGIIGFPNAGKSTLISRISAAKPKIANYPFTTLEPKLGVVRLNGIGLEKSGLREMVVADIPGLIEGASQGKGLGYRFLRHVERARVLLILIDLAEGQYSPEKQQEILLRELSNYNPALLERPRLVVGSRTDLSIHEEINLQLDLEISSVTGESLNALVGTLGDLVAKERMSNGMYSPGSPVLHRPVGEGISVVKEGAAYVIYGREATRAVAVSDLNDPDALAYVQKRLKAIGVDKMLRRAKCEPGDLVVIGDFQFTYEL
ncbi:MAG: GTPase ObgE [Firmicutes bacterium]|nr:GTPase ObgE [Bacillota bacterium]